MTTDPIDSDTWKVIHIPTPASEAHVELYKTVRLTALQSDPEVFASSYESESSLSDRTWHSRVDTEGRDTFVAVLSQGVVGDGDGDGEGDGDTGNGLGLGSGSAVGIGTLSVHGPQLLAWLPKERPYPFFLAQEELAQETDVYVLTGMWVHPDWRSKGVGRMLVERALEVIRDSESPSASDNSQDGEEKRRVRVKKRTAVLLVNDRQHAAKRLYRRAGFAEQREGDVSGKQSVWMTLRVCRHISVIVW